MISFKCRNCGGEMNVSRGGELYCGYCGSKAVLSDAQLREYREFRLSMLNYLSAIANTDADPAQTERIWRHAEHEELRAADGSAINIEYLFRDEQDRVTVYTARNNVLFVFKKGDRRAERFFNMVDRLEFPAADVRDLGQFFPVRAGVYPLEDGGTLIAVKKNEKVFPLSAFGALPPEHAAWIISRLENLCCVLAYSGIAHGGIGLESVFIDAGKHAAYLLGGWWNSAEKPEGSARDLSDIRCTAKRIMGVCYNGAPEELKAFISQSPAKNAFEDFTLWDETLKKAFGKRQFRRLDLVSLRL